MALTHLDNNSLLERPQTFEDLIHTLNYITLKFLKIPKIELLVSILCPHHHAAGKAVENFGHVLPGGCCAVRTGLVGYLPTWLMLKNHGLLILPYIMNKIYQDALVKVKVFPTL